MFTQTEKLSITFLFFADWSDKRNRRKFFEDYARDHAFDPMDPEAWYKQTKKRILAAQVSTVTPCFFLFFLFFFFFHFFFLPLTSRKKDVGKVLRHHNGVASALLNLFPDIGLAKSRLFPSTSM
jgi:hypothetical protein